MTKEIQDLILLAEFIGWTKIEVMETSGTRVSGIPPKMQFGYYGIREEVPPYDSILDCMHDAEKCLTAEQAERYMDILSRDKKDPEFIVRWRLCHVKAEDKFKAFIKLIKEIKSQKAKPA